MSIAFKKGSTDVILYFYARKDAADGSAGDPKTGLTYQSAGALAYYVRPGAAEVAITLATQTVDGTHSDGGFVLVDDTNNKGLYRFDPVDLAFATGADFVIIQLTFDDTVIEPQLIVLPTNTTSDNYGELTHATYGLSTQTGGGGGSGGVDPRPPF